MLIISNEIDFCYSGIMQSDGKILAVGTSSVGSNLNFVLVRFNNNGTLDSTFGTNGIVITDFNNYQDEAYSVTLQSDGKIVVAGYSDNATIRSFAVARYNNQILNSVHSSDNKNTISVFPNPTNNILKLNNLPNNCLIRVLDAPGKLVYETASESNNATLYLGHLEKGTYIVQILKDDFLMQKKVLITKE